jgi:hypothetical protein
LSLSLFLSLLVTLNSPFHASKPEEEREGEEKRKCSWELYETLAEGGSETVIFPA